MDWLIIESSYACIMIANKLVAYFYHSDHEFHIGDSRGSFASSLECIQGLQG